MASCHQNLNLHLPFLVSSFFPYLFFHFLTSLYFPPFFLILTIPFLISFCQFPSFYTSYTYSFSPPLRLFPHFFSWSFFPSSQEHLPPRRVRIHVRSVDFDKTKTREQDAYRMRSIKISEEQYVSKCVDFDKTKTKEMDA